MCINLMEHAAEFITNHSTSATALSQFLILSPPASSLNIEGPLAVPRYPNLRPVA